MCEIEKGACVMREPLCGNGKRCALCEIGKGRGAGGALCESGSEGPFSPTVEACRRIPQHLFWGPVGGGFEVCCSMLRHTEICSLLPL